jgi:hypothetical protein
MARQPYIAIRGDANGSGIEASHRDACLMQCGDSGEHGSAKGGGCRRSQMPA